MPPAPLPHGEPLEAKVTQLRLYSGAEFEAVQQVPAGDVCAALGLSGAKRPAVTALVVCAAYAASDEFHQCFSDGRGPSPVDVVIDTAGASIALGLRAAARRIGRGKGEKRP